MTDTVENTQRTMIPGMGEEGEKLTVAQNPAARAGGRDPVETRPEVELVCCVHLHLWHHKL